jgi:hypothetical protein
MKRNPILHRDSPFLAGIKRERNNSDSDDNVHDDNEHFLLESDTKRQRLSCHNPLTLAPLSDTNATEPSSMRPIRSFSRGNRAGEGDGTRIAAAAAATALTWSRFVGQRHHPSPLSTEANLLPSFSLWQATLPPQQQPPIRISLTERQDPDDIIHLLSSLTSTPAMLNVLFEHSPNEHSHTNDSVSSRCCKCPQQNMATHIRIFKALYSVRHPQMDVYVEWILQQFPDQIHLQILGMNVLRQMKLWDVATAVVMKSVCQHAYSWNLHLTGFALLAECAERSQEARSILRGSRDHVLHIFHAMQRFENEPRILCNASATLCWIVHEENHHRVSNPILPNDLISETTAIVKRLVRRYHRRDASTFGNLVCLLTAWEIDDDDFNDLKDTIVDGMQYHKQSIKVQEACLQWMHCALPRFDSDCLQTVLQSMQWRMNYHGSSSTIPSSSHFVAKACRLLAFWMPEHSSELLQSTAVEAVLTALRQFPQDANTVWATELFLNVIILVDEEDTTNPNMNHHHNVFGGGSHVIGFIFRGLDIQREEENVPFAQHDNIQEPESDEEALDSNGEQDG